MTDKYVKGLISVITPCYNGERFVADTIKSALGQTYPNVEMIVVDDGSRDHSVAIIEGFRGQYGDRLKLLQQVNQGPYPARNLGLKHAKGQYIAFLDSDDYWDKDCLHILQENLERSGADLCYSGWQNVGDGRADQKPYIPPRYEEGDIPRQFLKSCPWPIHAALTRHSVIDQVGGFSETWPTAMDFDLWLRISGLTHNICLVPEVLAYYRWHGATQISAQKWKQAINAWDVRRRFIAAHPSRVGHLDREVLRFLTDGDLKRRGYDAYWRRDLVSAQRLFRKVLASGYWTLGDLKYMVPTLLPLSCYEWLIRRGAPGEGRQDG